MDNKNIQDIISNKKSNWLNKAKYNEENDLWLEKSAHIALKILMYLREHELSKNDLSIKLGIPINDVNKIVKGNENLSLEIICKIEVLLGISIIEI